MDQDKLILEDINVRYICGRRHLGVARLPIMSQLNVQCLSGIIKLVTNLQFQFDCGQTSSRGAYTSWFVL